MTTLQQRIDAMCAGVKSCVDFTRSLWRTNSNDSINASSRATSIPVERGVQRLIDEGLDPRLAETIGLLSPLDLVGLGAGIVGAGKGKNGKSGGGNTQGAQEITAENFFDGTTYTPKVRQQATMKDNHGFPESVDGFSSTGTVTKITGGDGIDRLKLTKLGKYKG